MHRAVIAGKKTICALLVANKADISARSNDGKTPLDIAKAQGRDDLIAISPITKGTHVLIERLGPPVNDDEATIQELIEIGKPMVQPLSVAMANPILRRNAARALKGILGYPDALPPSIRGISLSWLSDGKPLIPALERDMASSMKLYTGKRLAAEALSNKYLAAAKLIALKIRSQFKYVNGASPEDLFETGEANCLTFSYAFTVLAQDVGVQAKPIVINASFQEDLPSKARYIACLIDLPDGKNAIVDLGLLDKFDHWDNHGVSEPFLLKDAFLSQGHTFSLKDSHMLSNLHRKLQVLGNNGLGAAHFHHVAGKSVNRGNWPEAKALYDKAISLEPSFSLAYLDRGKVLLNLHAESQAMADFQHASELDPSDAEPYHGIGIAHSLAGRDNEAMKSFAKAIHLNPKHGDAHLDTGILLFKRGQNQEAIPFLTKAIDIDPKCQKAYGQRGLSYVKLGMIEQALADFTKAIELDPTDFRAHQTRAVIYHFFLKEHTKALQDAERALKCAKTPEDKEKAEHLCEVIKKKW